MAAVLNRLAPYIKSNEYLSNPIKKALYNYFYRPNSKIIKIFDIDRCRQQAVQKIFEKSNFKNYLPKRLNTEERCIETDVPEVFIYQFEDAYISIASSAIWVKDHLITYRSKGERFNEGFVTAHNNMDAKVVLKETEELEEGFFLGGNGSWNWFHFMIEMMPKMMLFDEKYTRTIFVNEIVLKIPSMQTILEIFTKNRFTVKYLNQDKTYFVKKVYYMNDFNHIQFNRFDGQIKADGTFYNAETIRRFSDKIIENLPEKTGLPTKLFLYRKNTHRIASNQDEIMDYLKEFGFVPVCLEELSIDEQASYFKNAEYIIGISGAAWTNMIFCRNHPRAISFVAENAESFTAFSNLGRIFDVDFHIQLYNNNGLHSDSNFIINFEDFKELFRNINGIQ
ncbi:Protein of unknown function [Chryseobacterium oleae]|uniref:Glycosyltransferase 61 catalytic domain-containing protein n=1 Tax=Chryseobacterium oleae TaxID=491207 RepID=A0A1I4ZD00_CHROL|nr:glycosyltransferase family 61 protein [Chryseobacterium oleae]SFN48144.1 Protein of unknown function [Chryseobacterium oleae]